MTLLLALTGLLILRMYLRESEEGEMAFMLLIDCEQIDCFRFQGWYGANDANKERQKVFYDGRCQNAKWCVF